MNPVAHPDNHQVMLRTSPGMCLGVHIANEEGMVRVYGRRWVTIGAVYHTSASNAFIIQGYGPWSANDFLANIAYHHSSRACMSLIEGAKPGAMT